MREDMKHVLIDRPRTGGDGGKSIPPKGTKKKLQKVPLDEQKSFESNSRKRVYGYDCKQLNDHLGPLRRWLRSQVGRDWNEVWSEVCEHLSANGVATKHVRDHAQMYVEQNCMINEDGEICDSRGSVLSGYWSSRQLYVDPRDNKLCVFDTVPKWRNKPKEKTWVDGKDENHRYYCLNNIWYEVEFRPFPLALKHWRADQIRVQDLVISASKKRQDKKYTGSDRQQCVSWHGSAIYAFSKRQLGKREIHKLKLRDK